MTRSFGIVLVTLGLGALSVALAGVFFIYSGSYDVAATTPHSKIGRWILDTAKDRSIRAHARRRNTNVPAVDGEQLQHGIEHFVQMCTPCHGAPGVERGEYGEGMTPTPPDLAEAAQEWEAHELFWIIKHGIKLAGMPAFGPTHRDEELWGIVSFVQQLPNISADEYRRVAATVEQDHSHGVTTEGNGDGQEADRAQSH